ncbi:helix-turn-helix domain-containing protein [Myxococcota bacterium]
MIKNERQYRITKAQVTRFQDALANLPKPNNAPSGVHPRIVQAEHDALQSQCDDLRAELEEYNAIRDGQRKILALSSFAELPTALVQARIAAGMSQRDLAKALGLKEQQIQRYEATGYASASVKRVQEVMDALGVEVTENVFLPTADLSVRTLVNRLTDVGIDRNLVLHRLFPPSAADLATKAKSKHSSIAALRAATVISRVFGWTAEQLFGEGALMLPASAPGAARFKVKRDQDPRTLHAYAAYANYVARIVARVFRPEAGPSLVTDPKQIRSELLRSHGAVDLPAAVRWLWDCGIAVVPLSDSGAFHGASWRFAGRNVIVLKQRTRSSARWFHDLFHEYWHVAQNIVQPEFEHVEWEDAVTDHEYSADEARANLLAGDVALDGRAEELAEMCVKAANGSVERLKSKLLSVAKQEGVPVDALANYMAFRLSLQGINWWGAATNLQPMGNPFEVVREVFFEKADVSRLDEWDRDLLQRALSTGRE